MVKESKSAATIRRKRQKSASHEDAAPTSHARHKTSQDVELFDSGEEDPDISPDEPIGGPPAVRLIMSSDHTLFLGLLAFRVVNAMMIQSSYVPDEYWQSIEVAHNMAYGYGYLTWEWGHGLRGYTYPAIFAAIYKILALLHLDNRILLIKLPRLMQGLFCALGDLYLFKLSRKLSNQRVAHWTLLCQLTSWFTFYCGPRTLTNSMETVLTTIALYYFPWPGKPRKAQWKYLTVVGLAIVVRPTAAIVWLPLWAWHVFMYRHVAWRIIKLFAERGFIILSLSSILDRVCYGKWVYVQYNFLQFNVLSNMGTFYGSHPWHWYLSQGFPVIMGTHIFPFLLAVRKTDQRPLLYAMAWTIFVYSCLGHKEFRFIFPILPMALHICGVYLQSLCDYAVDTGSDDDDDDSDSEDTSHKPKHSKPLVSVSKSGGRSKFVVLFLVLTNLPLAMYTSLLHQRGTVDVMKFVHDESFKVNNKNMSVMFLMPCHSTPYYGYIHRNISMNFLTCEPNLSSVPGYTDEADVFFRDAPKWLSQHYSHDSHPLPTHLVMFNGLQSQILPFLSYHGYQPCAKFFHTHVPEGRVGTHVVVHCKYKPTPNTQQNRQKQGVKVRGKWKAR